ncbi:MAG: hypothetical protein ACJ71Q_12470 [Terriglobales bacterium]
MSWFGKKQETDRYATGEDFHDIFNTDLDGLYQLAYLLTADHQKAEQAFVSGVEDAVKSNHIFKKWARSWAKRVVVQNAIRLLLPNPAESGVSDSRFIMATAQPPQLTPDHFDLHSVLALERFERFVFVISVLERYSDQECGLLLGCPVIDVRQARAKALELLAEATRQTGIPEEAEEQGAEISTNRVISAPAGHPQARVSQDAGIQIAS